MAAGVSAADSHQHKNPHGKHEQTSRNTSRKLIYVTVRPETLKFLLLLSTGSQGANLYLKHFIPAHCHLILRHTHSTDKRPN